MTISDVGTDTLRRFRYQAEITVPFCLAAAHQLDGIGAVIPEHHEDIALDCGSTWRFLQVKSRNHELGLWTLHQLLAKGGALRSLYRTHKCVERENHSLELILEGAPKSGDPIMKLLPGDERGALVPPVAEALLIPEEAARVFISKVTLNAAPAPRGFIAAQNRDLIHDQAPHLTRSEVRSVHACLLTEIEAAMRAERMGSLWPRCVTRPSRRSGEMEERLQAKTLSADQLRAILKPAPSASRAVLERLVETGGPVLTPLRRKMLRGGAGPEIIAQARNLRANARREHLTRAAQGRPLDPALLEDLHQRLETHAVARIGVHASKPKPAPLIWADLVNLLDTKAGSIDHGRLLRQDPMLLLGETCELSDQCCFGWGEEDRDS